tara:strand:- start:732 stop:4307 length:3576 start_codon:yes stop_codon:yes gene_type:complete
MHLVSLVRKLSSSQIINDLYKRASRNERLTLSGGNRTTKALISSAIAKLENKSILILVPRLEDANRWISLLEVSGWLNPLLYPSCEVSPYATQGRTNEIVWGQMQVLGQLISEQNNQPKAIVATEKCLQPHLPPKELFASKCIRLSKGDEVLMEIVGNKLLSIGYERKSTISQEGEWSRRGDILDIFPVSSELPIRIEFFGDLIDKIKEFDPISQRSLDVINNILITPTNFESLIREKLEEKSFSSINKFLSEDSYNKYIDGQIFSDLRRFIGVSWNEPSSILDYLPKDICLAVDERSQIISQANTWYQHVEENYQELSKELKLTEKDREEWPSNLHYPVDRTLSKADRLFGFDLEEIYTENDSSNYFNLSSKSIKIPPNQFGTLAKKIRDMRNSKVLIWIVSAQPSRAVALLEEHECFSKFIPNPSDIESIDQLCKERTPIALKNTGNIEIDGIFLPVWNIALFTDKEFFGQQYLTSSGYIRKRGKASSSKINPHKMRTGDYVVHRNHGIGRFIKIEKSLISGKNRDYLVVKYEDGILRVAADQLGCLGRYRTSSEQHPKINKLGGKTWENTKKRAKVSLKKLAFDLVKLYAERADITGHSFPVDGPWQKEMEDSFTYNPTADQIKAVSDVKTDMERSTPMDRLVCGDVGFGKTEVAVRAIFKAVASGKQVALLAPTTVLAQQHWRTIKDRFAPYPIKVSLLNRFKTSSEKSEIVKELILGSIDVIIGTHLLLNKRVVYKDLGLLVIDEEQRFGVNQKEKIKTLKKDLDVLTLSATPIPRTLYMSISGVREMSLITTPPPGRRPIRTHLAIKDYEVIRSAICQEIERGGQVFYVVPRIENIEEVSIKLKEMIPSLSLLIAHGQMDEGQLENAMLAFNSGEAQLLLCTTIIESGLDIPRVNTILIEDSHRFGLSQLYQLRGRVGRSGIQAHAWLFYPQDISLTDSAKQRLRAIQEFADLGSGYQLAMRDMEIRGVGNILGVEQSGQMEAIGFDLYMEMLQEAIADIQGEKLPYVEDTQIDLKVNAFIPTDWISNTEEKLYAYKSASECNSHLFLMELTAFWIDKYGPLPSPVESLIQVLKLKIVAKTCSFTRIKQDKVNIILETKMEKSAFTKLRKALPENIQGRFNFIKRNDGTGQVIVRGLGVLAVEKQVDQLIEWIDLMSSEIKDSERYIKEQEKESIHKKDKSVIAL